MLALLQPLAAAADDDPRLVYAAGAPPWLRAVGRLRVPGVKFEQGRRSHYIEDCSATLVSRPGAERAATIVTAWHCLEYYADLSQRISFTLLHGSDEPIVSEAIRLADGGGMHADWAILRLLQPVPKARVAALAVHPHRADPVLPVSMAGYSRDAGKGGSGQRLTWDPRCNIIDQGKRSSDTDCTAFKGASGGAVVQSWGTEQARLSGVISQGDSAGLSTYVPVDGFRSALGRYLR